MYFRDVSGEDFIAKDFVAKLRRQDFVAKIQGLVKKLNKLYFLAPYWY